MPEFTDEQLVVIKEVVAEEIAAIENSDDETIEASQDHLAILNEVYIKLSV